MALSQADFYAYSRATGVPVPQDPREQAEMAPEVYAFRRNQVKAPQQGPDLGQVLGTAALGVGALVGGGLLARRIMGAGAQIPKAPPQSVTKGVQTADLSRYADVERIGRAPSPVVEPSAPPPTAVQPPSAPAPVAEIKEVAVSPRSYVESTGSLAPQEAPAAKRSVMPTEQESLFEYSQELTKRFPEPTAAELEALGAPSRYGKILTNLATQPSYRPDPKDINYAAFGPVSPEVATARREQATQDLLRAAQQRQEDTARLAEQNIGALESGEDQATGRVWQQLQRNEDLDLATINVEQAQVRNIDAVASQTADGLPVDQAEGAANFARARMEEQRARLESRGLRGQRLERAMVYPQSVREAVEESLRPEVQDLLTSGQVDITEGLNLPLAERAEPETIKPGGYVQPASKTTLRGTTGRPELGIYGIESGSTPGREVWGGGAIETQKVVEVPGEQPVSRPVSWSASSYGPEWRTPEGYVYTEEAAKRPSKPGASRVPLTQEVTPQRLESVKLSEEIRRLQRTGGDVQGFISEYVRTRGI